MRSANPLVLSLVLATAATAHPQQPWQQANKAMGAALQAGDVQAAASHARAALGAYRPAGALSEKTLVDLALNVAELSLQARKELPMAESAIRTTVDDLARKGSANAEKRIYLHEALLQLAEAQGEWREARLQAEAIVGASAEAYGPSDARTATAYATLARHLQLNDAIGPAATARENARKIVGSLPAGRLDRLAAEREIALFDLEGGRYKEAQRQFEGILAQLSTSDPRQLLVWQLATANLAAAQAKTGDQAKSDATMAKLIANTKENPKPTPLVIWTAADYGDVERQFASVASVSFDIGSDGHPTNIRADPIEGNPQYAAVAAKAVTNARYLPIIRNGVPQASTGHHIRFESRGERTAPTGSRVK